MIWFILAIIIIWWIAYSAKRAKAKKKKIAEFALLKAKEKAGTITDFEYQRMTELSFEIREHEINQLREYE